MKIRYPILIFGGLACSAWGFIYRPFPLPGDDPLLDLLLYHNPHLLRLDRSLVLRRARSRRHRRRLGSHHCLASLV